MFKQIFFKAFNEGAKNRKGGFMKTNNASPFLKWAGGKKQLLPVLNNSLPEEIHLGIIDTYVEPFVGGGALLFDLIQKFKFKNIIINDYNKDLVNLYKTIKTDVDKLIERLSILSKEYLELDPEQRKDYFYDIRNKFNDAPNGCIDKSAYLVFLNRTCFNGLYRVNSKNKFNVPHGRYKNPRILDKENLLAVSQTLKNITILNGDFTETEKYVDTNSFVYFDPPYRPLNDTSKFTSYSNNSFNDSEQIRLAKYFDTLHKKNAKLMLSNSDPQNTNKDDLFFKELYGNYTISKIEARRIINSNKNHRGKITELLITNY